MARRTERVLQQGQYVLATDLWYMTEVILEEECRAIDFYNVQYDIAYSGGISAKTAKQLGNARARDYAYEMMVNYRRLSTALAEADDDETPTPLSLNTMMRTVVHPALNLPAHVIFGSQSGDVFDTLAGDFMKPVVDIVEKVLNDTTVNVVVYNGQLDLICSTPGTVAWVNNMNWYGKKQYMSATRNAISVNGLLEGYVRKYGRFSFYWVSAITFLRIATVLNFSSSSSTAEPKWTYGAIRQPKSVLGDVARRDRFSVRLLGHISAAFIRKCINFAVIYGPQ
jgi:serine carboxypeptidase 1